MCLGEKIKNYIIEKNFFITLSSQMQLYDTYVYDLLIT